jgi:hypothetical protein
MTKINENQQELSWLQMIISTLAAVIGIQSSKNRKRDFTQGEIKKFIVVAIGFTLCFLVALISLVNILVAGF